MPGLTRDDLHDLRHLYAARGPVASVYFDTRASDEQEAWARWRHVADELARRGAAEATLQVVARRMLSAAPGPGMRAAFAAGSEILLAVDMPGATHADLGRFGDLPHLLPILVWLQERPAMVIALVDRTGADITVHPGGAAEPITIVVSGPDDEIERNAPGGWSQMRYQHRAEDSWEHNSSQVADVLARTLTHHHAHLLLLAGDVRALQYLEKHLPAGIRHDLEIRHVSGGRSPDGSSFRRAEQVALETHGVAEAEMASLLAQLEDERGPGGRGVDGVRPTLAALAQGRVGTLLLAPEAIGDRVAWYGPDAADVSDRRDPLVRAGKPVQQGPLTDVAVRAAILTRAEIRVLPSSVPDIPAQGIAALCRYA